MKRNKKGFTIVELVIVIAVIAILSAILIPTFVNLTDKANESRAKSEVADAYTMFVMDASDNYGGDLTEIKASDYSTTAASYYKGQMVKQGGKYYICNTAISAAGAFDSEKWDEFKASDVAMPVLTENEFHIIRESVEFMVDAENGGWKVASDSEKLVSPSKIQALNVAGTESAPVYSVGDAVYNKCTVVYKAKTSA